MIQGDGNSGSDKESGGKSSAIPRFPLDAYRKFIREASPYISVVAGRRVNPVEADTMTDQQVTDLALLIDSRVKDLKKI